MVSLSLHVVSEDEYKSLSNMSSDFLTKKFFLFCVIGTVVSFGLLLSGISVCTSCY